MTTTSPAPERKPAPPPRGGSRPAPRFFSLIPPNPGIDFIKLAPAMGVVSAIAVLLALGLLVYRGGLNYGIDFTGGTMVEVRFPQATAVGDVRAALAQPDLRGATVQDLGAAHTDFQIRVQGAETEMGSAVADAVRRGLQARFGEGSFDVLRVEAVGPKVGRDLWRRALLAVLASTVVMGAYLWLRFDLAFGIAAAIALLHDVLVTVGALALVHLEFDLTTVAALLTVVGFSVNDTVIISDRIRERRARMRRDPLDVVMNVAINETLSRTVITSGTAVAVTAALFVLGGSVIHGFAFTLLVGFLVGTYSSIFIAAPIVLAIEGRRARRR